jgi:hypothetical protein
MEDDSLILLKTVYDELWQDAKTMIIDMNRTIKSVFFLSFLMFVFAGMQFLSAHQVYMDIIRGSTRSLDYFYLVTISFGVVIMFVAGVWNMRSYNELKNRYSRLIELEKRLED